MTSGVRYRLRETGVYGPPVDHFPVGGGEYLAPADPTLDLLDVLGVIDVVDWRAEP